MFCLSIGRNGSVNIILSLSINQVKNSVTRWFKPNASDKGLAVLSITAARGRYCAAMRNKSLLTEFHPHLGVRLLIQSALQSDRMLLEICPMVNFRSQMKLEPRFWCKEENPLISCLDWINVLTGSTLQIIHSSHYCSTLSKHFQETLILRVWQLVG